MGRVGKIFPPITLHYINLIEPYPNPEYNSNPDPKSNPIPDPKLKIGDDRQIFYKGSPDGRKKMTFQ